MGTIYKIACVPTGKSYIGQTIHDVSVRIEHHLSGRSKKCRLLYSAIQKYSRDAFDYEILYDNIPPKLLSDFEKSAIRKFNTLAPNGYNLTPGGEGIGKKPPRVEPKPLPPITVRLNTLKIQGLLSQQKNEDIEKLLGVSRPTYLKLRKNPALIKLGDFVKICDHLNQDPKQFIEINQ